MKLGWVRLWLACCLVVPGFAVGKSVNKYAGIPTYWDESRQSLDVPRVFLDGTASRQEVLDWYAALMRDGEWSRFELEEIDGSNGSLWAAAMDNAKNNDHLVFVRTPSGFRYLDDLFYSGATAYVYPQSGITYLVTYGTLGWAHNTIQLSRLVHGALLVLGGRECLRNDAGRFIGPSAEENEACALWDDIRDRSPLTEAQLKQVFGF